ncbi:MAG: hypothetical protein ACXAE3_09000 [Candidatus Kariarchaeaceae archaeon]|jgi:rRNA small subunit pseudouridine methyltransferase Nep1
MRVILADCAVSLVPKDWNTHQNRKNSLLIDASFHQHLLKDVPLNQRKDRPDILHFALLTLQGYRKIFPEIEVLFQVDQQYFLVDPEVRLPRAQHRFYGVLADVLKSPQKNPYIQGTKPPFPDEPTIYFSPSGRPLEERDLQSTNFIFGGFAHGEYRTHSPKPDQIVSLSSQSLDLWTSLSLFLHNIFPDKQYI